MSNEERSLNPRTIGIFFDRDGTINVDVNFLRTPEEVQMIEGAAAAIRKLNDQGFTVCVISNQSGIARGHLSEADLIPIHERLERELRIEGAVINRFYYCPHHPVAGTAPYTLDCECRKPKPGMILQAVNDFGIDVRRSYVVGDSVVDIQAGNAVGATTILVQTGNGKKTLETCTEMNIPIDIVAGSIVEAVERIIDHVEGRSNHND